MRQSEMDLLLAKGEYEVRTYFLCGLSARTNNVNGTTMYLTNKRLVLEFMNNNEVSRREVPVDQITFVKSHYYEEEEDPTFAHNCTKQGIVLSVFSAIFLVLGVVGLLGVFDIFTMLNIAIPMLNFIFIGISVLFLIIAIIRFVKAKKFKPRVGKRLELLIGTSIDFEKGLSFTTDTTGKLRDSMRTYRSYGNSLTGKVQLSPTREAKKMTNELGALIIDIKAGLYDEDPELKAQREAEEREVRRQQRIEEQKKKRELEEKLLEQEEIERNRRKSRTETAQSGKKHKTSQELSDVDENIKKDREARMAKYGAPIEIDEFELDDAVPAPIAMQLKKSKVKVPKKNKTEDELIDEEYEAIMHSLNID